MIYTKSSIWKQIDLWARGDQHFGGHIIHGNQLCGEHVKISQEEISQAMMTADL
jgi:hypothetical protein